MTAPEFVRAFALDDLRGGKAMRSVEATAEERAALARRFELIALDALSAELKIVEDGAEIRISGVVRASGAQRCVAPLAAAPVDRAADDAESAFGRRAIARSRIGSQVEGAEDRLMSETNNKFTDTESTRRRSALAHLKRVAAATKADKVLSNVASRAPPLDPEEQSPYREDLAKVVRPRSGSRPISRPASKEQTFEEPWDSGTGDEDAAMFAAASEQSVSAFDDDDTFGRVQRYIRRRRRRRRRRGVHRQLS